MGDVDSAKSEEEKGQRYVRLPAQVGMRTYVVSKLVWIDDRGEEKEGDDDDGRHYYGQLDPTSHGEGIMP